MHALRTAIFTVKGLKSFMKEGYERHAQAFEPKCVCGMMRAQAACASASADARPPHGATGTWRWT